MSMGPKIIILVVMMISTIFLSWPSAARQPAVQPGQDVGYDFSRGQPLKLDTLENQGPQQKIRLIIQRQWHIITAGIVAFFTLVIFTWRKILQTPGQQARLSAPDNMVELPTPAPPHSQAS